MDLFQYFGIEYITSNRFFSIIYYKFQNLEILYYLIVVDIRVELRDLPLFNNS